MNVKDAAREPVVAFRVWSTCQDPATPALTGSSALAQPTGERGLYSVAQGIRWSGGGQCGCLQATV